VLSYNTVKIVTIRDARLGLLHYAFMFAIIGYVLVYTILIEQKYLLLERPIGSTRMSLLKGKAVVPLEDLEYCLLPNRTTLPDGKPIYPCAYQDELFVVYPVTEASAMFATTRYTFSDQVLNCSLLASPDCTFTTISNSVNYVANIEQFTLLIDHTVYAPVVGIKENAKALRGSLTFSNNTKVRLNAPNNIIGQKGSPDILQLQTLLEAAEIHSLDQNSTTNSTSTLRYDGVVLMIFIVYSNTETYNLGDISYTYKPTLISETEFKSIEPILGTNTRQVYNRHGIRMIFIQDGLLGKFDFQTTLLTFVSGLGLLTVSTVVVDLMAVYVLPYKQVYRKYKYKDTDPQWHPKHALPFAKLNPAASVPLLSATG